EGQARTVRWAAACGVIAATGTHGDAACVWSCADRRPRAACHGPKVGHGITSRTADRVAIDTRTLSRPCFSRVSWKVSSLKHCGRCRLFSDVDVRPVRARAKARRKAAQMLLQSVQPSRKSLRNGGDTSAALFPHDVVTRRSLFA